MEEKGFNDLSKKLNHKKKQLITIILTVLTAVMALTFVSCEKEVVPRDVELVLINPNTGEPVEDGDTVIVPDERTVIDARVLDKETGKVLTSEDLKFETIGRSLRVYLYQIRSDGKLGATITNYLWPTREKIDTITSMYGSDVYEMTLSFDCRPDHAGKDFVRYYKSKITYIRFHLIVSDEEEKG